MASDQIPGSAAAHCMLLRPVRPGLFCGLGPGAKPLDIAEAFPTIRKSYVRNVHYVNNCAHGCVPKMKGPEHLRSRREAPVWPGLIGCGEIGERECR